MLNVITLFSGYDSQCLALNRLGLPYDLAAWCEIDKYAIKAHNALFPQYADRNLGDVSKVVWSDIKEPIDLLTYSSPCQDFSQAGLQRGGEKGSGTRSGLLWECERAIGVLKPKYLVFENVPALVSEKFIDTFLAWGRTLHTMGYRNYWQCLNAKNYGVPQNRNRVFMVSILGDEQQYYWPKPFPLERRLKDVLEKEVPESYYLSEDRIQGLLDSTRKEEEEGRGFAFEPKDGTEDYANSVTTNAGCRKTDNFIIEPQIEVIGELNKDNRRPKSGSIRQQDYVIGTNGVSMAIPSSQYKHPFKIAEPQMLGWTRNEKGEITNHRPVSIANCVTAAKRDNTQNYIVEPKPLIVPQATKEGYAVVPEGGVFDASYPDSKTRRGRVQEGGTVSPTIMASQNELLRYEGIRIRRLTERELFRLMDMDDADIDTLLSAGIAKTQLAKMSGNSIVVNVLYHIFKRLLVDTEAQNGEQMKLF